MLAWSEGDSRGKHFRGFDFSSRSRGESRNYPELKRMLIRPEELMHDTREDDQFIVPKTGRPLRCGRAIYFRRPEFVRWVKRSRFAA